MNKKVKYLIPLLLIFCSLPTFAQVKIGIVDYENIFSNMPETTDAEKKLNQYFTEQQQMLQDEEIALEKLYTQYIADSAELNAYDKKKMEYKISAANSNLTTNKQLAQSGYERQKEMYLVPIRKKLDTAINSIAKQEKYTLILYDNYVFYHLPADNISNKVRVKLGLKVVK